MRRVLLAMVLGLAGASLGQPVPVGPVVPRVIEPGGALPDRTLSVDLGERKFSAKEEAEGGKEVEEFYGKEGRVVRDPRAQARIEAILQKVVTAAAEIGPKQVSIEGGEVPPLKFTIRILNSNDYNAFSAWGGSIFVTRGMLDFCQSDDELAGVIAHEVAHSTYRHLREQAARLRRYQAQQLLAMIAAGFMGINVADAGIMAQYVYLALYNGHSVTAEEESDYAGVYYAYRAGYNPVGMLTTFERLHRWQMTQPVPTDMGAFQTHPWSDERARQIEGQLAELDVPVDRRAVTQSAKAMVRSDAEKPGAAAVWMDEFMLYSVAADGDRRPAERAAEVVLGINRGLVGAVRAGSLSLLHNPEHGWYIVALDGFRRVELLTLTPADAALAGQPYDAFARLVYNRLSAAMRQAETVAGVG